MAYPAGACHSHAGKQAPVVQYNTDLGNKTPAFTFVSNIAARHQSGVLNPTSSSGLLAVCFSVFCLFLFCCCCCSSSSSFPFFFSRVAVSPAACRQSLWYSRLYSVVPEVDTSWFSAAAKLFSGLSQSSRVFINQCRSTGTTVESVTAIFTESPRASRARRPLPPRSDVTVTFWSVQIKGKD